MSRRKPTLAVWKFASCDGCQLTLLDCEDHLLRLASVAEIARFPEATSTVRGGPYDVSLVDGSISTPGDAVRIHAVRKASRVLVTLGACAAAGGIQGLRNFLPARSVLPLVYPVPQDVETLPTSTAIADHVAVDFTLRGCPINKEQLLHVLGAFLQGRTPTLPDHPLCVDCKRAGVVCVMVAAGTPCLGPVTHAGCGVLCPRYQRGCYGCFGPCAEPNTASLARAFWAAGCSEEDLVRVFRTFNAQAPEFRAEGDAHEPAHHQG